MRFVSLAGGQASVPFAFSQVCPHKGRDIPLDLPAKEASVVETDRQIDLCSEHAKRPASVPGLWWCEGPIVGIGSGGQWWKSPVTDLPGAVAASTAYRAVERAGRANPPSHAADPAQASL